MNNSTEGVKISAAFIQDIINIYEGKDEFQSHLKKMTEGYDLSNALNFVPMELYNNMCNWIESQIGKVNTKRVGRKIGETAYQGMLANGFVNSGATPQEMMQALQKVASVMIKDPEKRGWEIVESAPKFIILKRTQTFNSTLQFGLLDELIRKTNVLSPRVEYVKEVAAGDEFDEYKIQWL